MRKKSLFLLLIILAILSFCTNIGISKSKIQPPKGPYDLNPDYGKNMVFEERHYFTLLSDFKKKVEKKTKSKSLLKFKASTKYVYTVLETDCKNPKKVKIEFAGFSGVPVFDSESKTKDERDKFKKSMSVSIKKMKKQWVIAEVSEESMNSVKMSSKLKSSKSSGEIVHFLLDRPLKLFTPPDKKVKVGDIWKSTIPGVYHKILKFDYPVSYKLDRISKKSSIYIAKIKLRLKKKKTEGDITIRISGSGEVLYDLINNVIVELKFKLEEKTTKGKDKEKEEKINKYEFRAKYKYKNYGETKVKQLMLLAKDFDAKYYNKSFHCNTCNKCNYQKCGVNCGNLKNFINSGELLLEEYIRAYRQKGKFNYKFTTSYQRLIDAGIVDFKHTDKLKDIAQRYNKKVKVICKIIDG